MERRSSGDVTRLLAELNAGNKDALPALLPLVYDELRRVAQRYFRRERSDHTLQPTALVHEAYLRLVDQRNVQWQNRAHFMGVAAQAMRRILVDRARAHHAAKRGGEQVRVAIDEAAGAGDPPLVDYLALDEALTKLAALDPQQSRIVELRYFGGLTIEETAEALELSPMTIKREWRIARAWLHCEMGSFGDRRA
jgi:RNA polymerase sigma factor (TIGR02999 family)